MISEEKRGSPTRPKTFWINTQTLDKIKTLQDLGDPDDVIHEIKKAIELKVEELFGERPEK